MPANDVDLIPRSPTSFCCMPAPPEIDSLPELANAATVASTRDVADVVVRLLLAR